MLTARRSCTAPVTGRRSSRSTRAARSWCKAIRGVSIPTTSGGRSSASGDFSLAIVGDAFARAADRAPAPRRLRSPGLRVIGSGGAMLSPRRSRRFSSSCRTSWWWTASAASETGAQGASFSAAGSAPATRFTMDAHTVVLDEALTRRLEPGDSDLGWLARTGHMPLGYLGDEAKTRRTYPTIDGVRYAVPGDRARLARDGAIHVLGRDAVCINSGGEKIFAEEVEQALKRHPAVFDVLVTGTPSARWGERVTAVVALRAGTARRARRAARRGRAGSSRATSSRGRSSSSTRCSALRPASPTTSGRSRSPSRRRPTAPSDPARPPRVPRGPARRRCGRSPARRRRCRSCELRSIAPFATAAHGPSGPCDVTVATRRRRRAWKRAAVFDSSIACASTFGWLGWPSRCR